MMQQQRRRNSLPPLKSPRRRHPVDAFHHKNNNYDDDNLSAASGVAVAPISPSNVATPYSGIIQKHVNNDGDDGYTSYNEEPVFGLSKFNWEGKYFLRRGHNDGHNATPQKNAVPIVDSNIEDTASHYYGAFDSSLGPLRKNLHRQTKLTNGVARFLLVLVLTLVSKFTYESIIYNNVQRLLKLFTTSDKVKGYPEFVFDHPYVTSSYYVSTSNIDLLEKMQQAQVEPNRDRPPDRERGIVSRLAIMRPFCEFDAGPLPTTFACWNSLVPCRAAEDDLGVEDDKEEWVLFDTSVNGVGRKLAEDEKDDWECEADYDASSGSSSSNNSTSTSFFRGIANNFFTRCRRRKPKQKEFDDVPADRLRTTSVDLFLFYSQTFSDNHEAVNAVDTIMEEFFTPGGWSRCFDNIYAVEANIPQELDLYIPTAQEELYNWVNGPNRQYEAGFRIIQSGEWGDYDGFYLMEGDSVRCPCLSFVHPIDVSPVCSF